jgi:hypothetical protein
METICPFCAELYCPEGEDYCGATDCRRALRDQYWRELRADDGLSDRSDRAGRDSFAHDNHGHDTGLRESDFI